MSAGPLAQRSLDSIAILGRNHRSSFGELLSAVGACAALLPKGTQIVNACRNRRTFTIVFLAAIANRQTNLLLPGRSDRLRSTAAQKYATASWVDDTIFDRICTVSAPSPASVLDGLLTTPMQHIAAIVYSSGTTGLEKGIFKTWHSLIAGAHNNSMHLHEYQVSAASLVATVPPWHMYGLEWTLMLLLASDIAVSPTNSLFPDDIRSALDQMPAPRILLSTPLHLRGLVQSGIKLPSLATVISATAPLDEVFAGSLEQEWNTQVLEIYGCSELGSIAMRFPSRTHYWKFFDEFTVTHDPTGVAVGADHTGAAVRLPDQLVFDTHGRFKIIGRDLDLIKIGGKRGSLAELNKCLLTVPGVLDGVLFNPDNFNQIDNGRLAAIVIAPDHSPASLREELLKRMDRAFVPRNIYNVTEIPRTETGKLRLSDLKSLLLSLQGDAYER